MSNTLPTFLPLHTNASTRLASLASNFQTKQYMTKIWQLSVRKLEGWCDFGVIFKVKSMDSCCWSYIFDWHQKQFFKINPTQSFSCSWSLQ